MTIEEIADRIEKACRRDSFEACRRDLPVLGQEAMEAMFAFYEQGRQASQTLREIERFAGNIRHGLFEDYIKDLIKRGENAIRLCEQQVRYLPHHVQQVR